MSEYFENVRYKWVKRSKEKLTQDVKWQHNDQFITTSNSLLILVQIFLIWDAKLSLLSTYIARKFVNSEFSRLIPSMTC